MKDMMKKVWHPLLTTILVALFPVLFLYFNNLGIVSLDEALLLCIIFAGIAFVLFAVALVITHSGHRASLIASVFCAVLFNFALIEKAMKIVLHSFYYWQMVMLVVFIALHIAWLIWKKCSLSLVKDICNIACMVLSGLIVFNGVMAVPQIINKVNAEKILGEEQSKQLQHVKDGTTPPNIYLLIFDEFAGFDQMEQAYGYDNRLLKDFLTANAFTISYNSYNESILTSTVTTNLVNLDYIVDDTFSEADKAALRKTGELFSLLQNHGYDIRKLTDGDFYGEPSQIAVTSTGKGALSIEGDSFKDIVLKYTACYPFILVDSNEVLNTKLTIIEYLSNEIPQVPTFSIMHLTFPHQPFLVDGNGKLISTDDSSNWSDPSIYQGQYIYATKLMIELLGSIKEKDSNSLIMVISDHSARGNKGLIEEKSKPYRNNSFNSFYYQGNDLTEYVDKSLVNTLRVLLNLVIGTDFQELEVPEFE